MGQASARKITTKVKITRVEGGAADSPSFRQFAVERLCNPRQKLKFKLKFLVISLELRAVTLTLRW